MLVRRHFEAAARSFTQIVRAVGPQDWDGVGLGEWSVRALTGHAARALLTIESYRSVTAEPARPVSTGPILTSPVLASPVLTSPVLTGPVDYFRAAAAALAGPAAVAERGRQAGAALGNDPAAAVSVIARRVRGLVSETADGALMRTPVGIITLVDYLPTRTFELTVHGLDLAAAVEAVPPTELDGPLAASLLLAAQLAVATGRGTEVLLALTGRRLLPAPFNVVF